ncbi:MAG: glycosyltransferase family 4 protein [Candidatus Dormibacteria bacterium]
MGRALRIGIHSPFFGSTLGGGEKYLGGVAEAIRDEFPAHSIELVTPAPVDEELYRRMLGLDLRGIAMRRAAPGNSAATAFMLRRLNQVNSLRRFRNLALAAQALAASRRFDLFISMVYVIPAVSRARRSLMICQFPYELNGRAGKLWQRELRGFDPILCYSDFVGGWILRYWGREATVVNPPIDIPTAEPDWKAKENTILSIGRFFAAGHNKRQDLMVRCFRELVDDGLQGWKLVLAGSVHNDALNAGYHDSVVQLAQGYPIEIHTAAGHDEIQAMYRTASIYWHAAGSAAEGSGASAEVRPVEMEHFGMTSAEAMGHGAVPVVINAGGQPEVVRDGIDGYLWRSTTELKSRTLELTEDPALRQRMGEQGRAGCDRFSRDAFRRGIVSAVRPIIDDLQGPNRG